MTMRRAFLLLLLALFAGMAQARVPDGWPFLEYNEAVRVAKKTNKPLFVYYGFETCPYCIYLNKNTLSFEALRKRYGEHYVLAYFDIRANPNDPITLPTGETLPRGQAIRKLKGSPVPAWAFVAPDGREILMRRGSRTKVDAFMKFDQYVMSGTWPQTAFADYLAQRGLQEDKVE
ncbi:MAG: thioredoxin family protein [Betaproteobacteria bacterium]|nr:thioredoxin family protein [Betaproteobacteria bacterium]